MLASRTFLFTQQLTALVRKYNESVSIFIYRWSHLIDALNCLSSPPSRPHPHAMLQSLWPRTADVPYQDVPTKELQDKQSESLEVRSRSSRLWIAICSILFLIVIVETALLMAPFPRYSTQKTPVPQCLFFSPLY